MVNGGTLAGESRRNLRNNPGTPTPDDFMDATTTLGMAGAAMAVVPVAAIAGLAYYVGLFIKCKLRNLPIFKFILTIKPQRIILRYKLY